MSNTDAFPLLRKGWNRQKVNQEQIRLATPLVEQGVKFRSFPSAEAPAEVVAEFIASNIPGAAKTGILHGMATLDPAGEVIGAVALGADRSGAREECTPTATRTTPAGSSAPGVLSTPDKQNRCRGSLLRRDPCPRSQLATRSPRCFASSNFPARAHRVLTSTTQTAHPPALEGKDACVRGSHDPIDREGGLN